MITITIDTTTPGFKPAPQLEAARILRSLADKVERAATVQDLDKLPLRDREGQIAGSVNVGTVSPSDSVAYQAFVNR
jgi:hypothetical protein